MTLKKV